MQTKKIAMAVVLGLSTMAPAAFAADPAKADAAKMNEAKPDAAHQAAPMDKEARLKMWNDNKDALEEKLGVGHDKAHYRQSLEDMGYAITAVNSDDDDYLEYEIMKDGETYEVQVDFENGVSNEVDVTTNLWAADSTKAALSDGNYEYVYPAGLTPNPDHVSDRRRSEGFLSEKSRLEEELGVGHDRDYYPAALEKMGYKVTSVNDRDDDNLELEVVKGDTSYEVDIDFDETSKMSTDVTVGANIWESEATEKAKGEE